MGRPKIKRYVYKSPESEARARANLKRGKDTGSIEKIITKTKRLKDLDIIQFATDKDYLGLSFEKRPAQEVILRVLYGLPLDKKQLKIFKVLTKGKGKYIPGQIKNEAVMALGARSGKSLISSICALYEATRGENQKYVSKGEYVYIAIIATREKQAIAIIQTNCLRMLNNSPVLKKMISKTTELEITLKNNIKIVSGPCNSTALRGLGIAVLILDECAFYRIEGPKADEAIFNSLRPRQAQFPDNKLFLISTAGAKQGLFYNYFNEGFKIQDRLTMQGSTAFCNPLIPSAFLEKEKRRDIDNFKREFEGVFSEKLESFFSWELMQKPFVLAGDLPYNSEFTYYLALDQSGLSGRDRFALSIGHKEGETAVIDVVRSWETKDLNIILGEIKILAETYFISVAVIDRYSRGYVENSFKGIGLGVLVRPSLAEVYVVLKSLMIKDNLKLPDRPDLRAGLRNTIAIYNKSNQLTIIHERGPSGHSDTIDAIAGCVNEIVQVEPEIIIEGKTAGHRLSFLYLEEEDREYRPFDW